MNRSYTEMLSIGMGWYYERSNKALRNVISTQPDARRQAEASAELDEISRLGGLFFGETNERRHSSADRQTALCNSIDDDEALFRLEANLLSGSRATIQPRPDSWFITRVQRDLDRIDEIIGSSKRPAL